MNQSLYDMLNSTPPEEWAGISEKGITDQLREISLDMVRRALFLVFAGDYWDSRSMGADHEQAVKWANDLATGTAEFVGLVDWQEILS